MIAELYANLCGTELWNRARLARYMANGIAPPKIQLRCSPCEGLEDLIPCLEDVPPDQDEDSDGLDLQDGYQLPELDPAPWYEAAAPESMNFAGLLVLETTLSQPVDRRLVQNIGHGATLTRTRFEGRTLTVRGLLVGKTCCATAYGMKWLMQALLGSYCGSCDGCALTFLTCAPTAVETECLMVTEASGARVPYFRADPDQEMTRGTDFARQMFDVGVLQGPTVTKQHPGQSCGGCGVSPLTEIEFTLGIGNPWMYEIEELILDEVLLPACTEAADCNLTFVDVGCDPTDPCSQAIPCDVDPDWPVTPTAPPAGRFPAQEAGCLPFLSERSCAVIPAGKEWFDQALIIDIYAGSTPLRNLAIRTWQNPMGLEGCSVDNAEYFSDCAACATLLVGYIPAFGTLHFDSVKREVNVTCKNVTRPASRNVGTLDSLPFEWLEVGCQPLVVGFDVDCLNISEDATISVWRAGREL